jgi:hypothetical protein
VNARARKNARNGRRWPEEIFMILSPLLSSPRGKPEAKRARRK